MNKNILLLMMGGSGTRFGADIPKQYIEVDGIPIFAYILKKYGMMKEIDEIVIVSNESWIEFANDWAKKCNLKVEYHVVEGGQTRSESVFNGLKEINKFASSEDVILIHDATHPYVDVKGTCDVIDAVNKYGAATLGVFQYDTVYRMSDEYFIEEVVPRQEIVAGASPEAFRFKDIYNIYSNSSKEEFEK